LIYYSFGTAIDNRQLFINFYFIGLLSKSHKSGEILREEQIYTNEVLHYKNYFESTIAKRILRKNMLIEI
jgi:hypothetical protein